MSRGKPSSMDFRRKSEFSRRFRRFSQMEEGEGESVPLKLSVHLRKSASSAAEFFLPCRTFDANLPRCVSRKESRTARRAAPAWGFGAAPRYIRSGTSMPSSPRPTRNTRAVTRQRVRRVSRGRALVRLEHRARLEKSVEVARQFVEIIRQQVRAEIVQHRRHRFRELRELFRQIAFRRFGRVADAGMRAGASGSSLPRRKIERMRTYAFCR